MQYDVDSSEALDFFQAEDGIRDIGVTGVQTCALPILLLDFRKLRFQRVVFFGIFQRHLLIAVLLDPAEGNILIELVQYLVDLFQPCRNLRYALLLFLHLVRLLYGKALFHQRLKVRLVADRVIRDFTQHLRNGLHEQIGVDVVRGMALWIFGFALAVFATKGNVFFAAVPVIYANVHFRPAVLTEKQARQGVDFSVPVWSFDGRIFQYALHGFKGIAVDNRLMHVFKYLPLLFIYIVVALIPVMLRRFEVRHVAAILLSCENAGQGRLVPMIAVFLVQISAFCCSSVVLLEVKGGRQDFLIFQIDGDLISIFTLHEKTENQADNGGGFLVDYP